MAAVGGLVHAVERAAAVQQVDTSAVLPGSGGEHAVDHRGQMAGAVDDRGVHDLTLTAGPCVVEGGEYAGDQIEGAAGVVAEQVDRGNRRAVGGADHAQRPGDGDVPDVVSRTRGERTVLAPAGHPPVHQAGVAFPARLGADPQALSHARPVALDEYVGVLDELQHRLGTRGLQIHHDRTLVAPREVAGRVDPERRATGAVDSDHIRAQVGQQHASERARSDSGQLHDPHAGKWPALLRLRCHRTSSRHVTPMM